jgi:hypothetical protein
LQFVDRLFQHLASAKYTNLRGHDRLHLGHERRGILGAAAVDQDIDLRLFAAQRFLHETGGNIPGVLRALAKVGDTLAHDHAGHHRIGHRVAAQPIKAVHVPAGRFTGRKQSLEGRTFPGVVRAHSTHRVVLRRSHRYPLLHRIDAEKIVADLVHLAQVVLDVMLAQECDIQPEVLAKP